MIPRTVFYSSAFLCLIIIMGLSSCNSAPGGTANYRYEPHESVIAGTLMVGIFYGRPGYGETPDIDEKESALILVLDAPIDVMADETDELNGTRRGITEIQLLIPDEKGIDLKMNLNQRLRVKGTLFSSHTSHHHTPVLMDVTAYTALR